MHSLGFIHNDLHTYNIFIDKREPYIIDYGLTNYIDPSDSKTFRPIRYPFNPEYYFKTLGNLFQNTLPGSKDGLTVKDQYCKRAHWSCERGVQARDAFFMCNPEISEEEAKTNLLSDNESGYIIEQSTEPTIFPIENLLQLQPLQEIAHETDDVPDNESFIPEMRMSQSVKV